MGPVNRKWIRWELLLIAISIMIAIAFAVWMAIIAADRKLTPLEAALFQFVVLVVGLGGSLIGSYKFGQNMPANKQYARSALRSVLVMFRSLRRSYEAIERLKAAYPSDVGLDSLQLHIEDQMDIASSVINDWAGSHPRGI